MIIYNKTLEVFRKRLKKQIKEILKQECNIQVRNTRFNYNGYLYPIEVILFEKENVLGYFDSEYFTIGLHRNLLLIERKYQHHLMDILRHEIAHYLCFIEHGDQIQNHGNEFRNKCRSFGWDDSVFSAKLKLDKNLIGQQVNQQSAILEKIKKLLSLAESDNTHESQMATAKANELLQKYHLDLSIDNNLEDEDDEMVSMTVWEGKRNSSKMMCISEILGHFFVYPYFNYGKNKIRLEVLGDETQVEVANYLCKYYISEFEVEWKKQKSLKGMKQKNSFFRGLTQGHLAELNQLSNKYSQSKEIILAKQVLQKRVHQYLPHLGGKYHDYKTDRGAESLGRSHGKNMQVRKGIGETNLQKKLLGFFQK